MENLSSIQIVHFCELNQLKSSFTDCPLKTVDFPLFSSPILIVRQDAGWAERRNRGVQTQRFHKKANLYKQVLITEKYTSGNPWTPLKCWNPKQTTPNPTRGKGIQNGQLVILSLVAPSSSPCWWNKNSSRTNRKQDQWQVSWKASVKACHQAWSRELKHLRLAACGCHNRDTSLVPLLQWAQRQGAEEQPS